ncbi:hypothetical protein [Shewanella algae]|uniref:hypothetical protein n=1 Tax=Shewanella algae TaxID=38313 RepID=UPI000AAE990B|nr:hypothetical protein [Shewanella algae]
MLIKFSEELMRSSNDLVLVIMAIVTSNGKHSFCTESSHNVIATLNGNDQVLSLYKEYIVKQANGIVYENVVEIVINNPGLGQLSVSQIAEFMGKAAVIILENSINDTAFLKLILASKKSRNILDAYGNYWRVESPGGCGQIPALIDALLDQRYPASRLFVIHDSDKLFPTANLERTHVNIINKCRDNNIVYHTLSKREMENYIIDELLKKIIGDTDFLILGLF